MYICIFRLLEGCDNLCCCPGLRSGPFTYDLPKYKLQWHPNTLTCPSAMGQVSDHPVASCPFGTTRLTSLWPECLLRQRNERLSRWWHGALLTYSELFYRRNYEAHGRPQENCSSIGVAHIATLTASSSFKPHEAITVTSSQSPLCCVKAARNEARWCAELRVTSTIAL